jgi:tetratricopeptide (TPR) repeat protein
MTEETVVVEGLVDVPQPEVALILEAGYLLMELGKWKEAQEVFGGASALVPHSDVPLMALGNLFFAQGKFQQALKSHKEALATMPDSQLARAHVGECLLFMKKYDEGKAELEKAIAQDPQSMAATFAKSLLEAHDVGVFDKV